MEAALDIIVDFRGSLTQIRPLVGAIAEAVLIGTLCTPDNTCGGAGRVKAGMRTMTFVGIAELAVDIRAKFAGCRGQ